MNLFHLKYYLNFFIHLKIGHQFSAASTPRNIFINPHDCTVNAHAYTLKNSFVKYRVAFVRPLCRTESEMMTACSR